MDAPSLPRTAAPLALAAAVLATLAALLAAMAWRLSALELRHAWPWFGPSPEVGIALGLVGAATLLVATAAWRVHRAPAWRRSLLEMMLWPAVPMAVAWLVMPAQGSPGPVVPLAGCVAAAVAWWLYRREARAGDTARPVPAGLPRARWIWLHVVAVLALVAAGLLGEGFDDPLAFAVSLALYPIYAFCQLFLVLAVAWPRLNRLGGGGAGPLVAMALLFALVHWPNPALMLLSGGGMAFWAAAYARGRGLVVLALSMGLLASLAAQGLPNRWTDHMRAGPRYVRMRAVPREAAAADRRLRQLPAGERRTQALLADLYPGVTGRAAVPGELDRWWRSIAACRRGVLAWRFYISEEYRRKTGGPAGEEPLPGDVHWTRLPPPWPERIGAYTHDRSDWAPFIALLYREILGREATPEEIATWRPDLSRRQQRRLLRVLLDHRQELAESPFDTCTCARMRLHH